mmetsp:Transcript_5850/g.11553  ORF Transcript_5850/g.11553 Transcript_5850/m.11553 type:complete len:124 (+) Transcript_5850:31-402(+)
MAKHVTLVLLALACSCDAWHVPSASVTAHRPRRTTLLVSLEEPAASEPAASEPPIVPPPSSSAKGQGQGSMPTDFLGFIDVNTGGGSLAASLIVAVGFCVLVEFVKFIDKNPSSASIFGSLWS